MANEDFVLRDTRLPMAMADRGYPTPAEGLAVDEQNIRNVLFTTVGERVNRPLFGSYLVRMVHRTMSTRLFILILAEVRRAVRSNLPELVVIAVDFEVTNDVPGKKRVIATVEWDRQENVFQASHLRRSKVTSIEIPLGGG